MIAASLLSALDCERCMDQTQSCASGAMWRHGTTAKWETRRVKLLLSRGSGQGFREYWSVEGLVSEICHRGPERRGHGQTSDESEPPPDSLQTPRVMESSLGCPEDNTAGLACSRACVTGISFWRRTFGKTLGRGELSGNILLLKGSPKL